MTLHFVESPPATVVDRQETIAGFAIAVTVKETTLSVGPNRAVMTTKPVRVGWVEKPKFVLLVPAGIVTDAATTSPTLVDDRFTVVGVPGLLRVTVQVPPVPGTTLVGLQT